MINGFLYTKFLYTYKIFSLYILVQIFTIYLKFIAITIFFSLC